jgi:hypothetical protein
MARPEAASTGTRNQNTFGEDGLTLSGGELEQLRRALLLDTKDEFERGFSQVDEQPAVQLGNCAVTVRLHGELGEILQREQPRDND